MLMRQVITAYPEFRISYDATWQIYDLELDSNGDEAQSQLINNLLDDNMSVFLRVMHHSHKWRSDRNIGVNEMSIHSKGVKFVSFAFSVKYANYIEFPAAYLPEELEALEQLTSFMSTIHSENSRLKLSLGA